MGLHEQDQRERPSIVVAIVTFVLVVSTATIWHVLIRDEGRYQASREYFNVWSTSKDR